MILTILNLAVAAVIILEYFRLKSAATHPSMKAVTWYYNKYAHRI